MRIIYGMEYDRLMYINFTFFLNVNLKNEMEQNFNQINVLFI